MFRKFLTFLISLFLIGLSFFSIVFAQENDDFSKEAIMQRIKPVGEPTVAGEEKKSEKDALIPNQPTAPLTGEQIYNQYCSVCHAIGVAGAPKFKDKSGWEVRGGRNAINNLVKSAIQGKNAMPPKGNCINCQEIDIRNAILFMVPAS